MHTIRTVLPLVGAMLIAGCIPPAPEPTPAPTPAPAPGPAAAPAPAPVAVPKYDNWMDAPATPGAWRYSTDAGGAPLAAFGEANSEPRFAMRCNRARRVMIIERAGSVSTPTSMIVRTETIDRQLTAKQADSTLPRMQAELAAYDPLLDAMAFSKGRFAVEVAGQATLYLPAWTEVTRVIEECRS